MAAGAKAARSRALKTTIGSAIVAAIFFIGSGQSASAQAPIVYASAAPAEVRFSNRIETLPASEARPDQPAPRRAGREPCPQAPNSCSTPSASRPLLAPNGPGACRR